MLARNTRSLLRTLACIRCVKLSDAAEAEQRQKAADAEAEALRIKVGKLSKESGEATLAAKKLSLEMERLEQCIICMDNKRSLVFEPCGHVIACHVCFKAMWDAAKQAGLAQYPQCPVCKEGVTATFGANWEKPEAEWDEDDRGLFII